jgi:hypothetical protein
MASLAVKTLQRCGNSLNRKRPIFSVTAFHVWVTDRDSATLHGDRSKESGLAKKMLNPHGPWDLSGAGLA